MNIKEKNIILNQYYNILYSYMIVKIEKDDSRREILNLLYSLGMKKEAYQVKNKIISERDNLNSIQIEAYEMTFKTFLKYGYYVEYALNDISSYQDCIDFEFTQEEQKCHKARIENILSYH